MSGRRFPREPIIQPRTVCGTSADLIIDRVRRCRQVEVEGVEHVQLDGFDHYLASSLLEELVA